MWEKYQLPLQWHDTPSYVLITTNNEQVVRFTLPTTQSQIELYFGVPPNQYILLHNNKVASINDINKMTVPALITVIDLRVGLLVDKLKHSGFMLSITECCEIQNNVHTLSKFNQKLNLVRFCRSYPFSHDAAKACQDELRIYSAFPHVCYTTHSNNKYFPVTSDSIFSKREKELLSLSKKKNLKYHDNYTRNVIYAAVFRQGDIERLYIGKAKHMKNRWGTSGTSHFAIVRKVIQDSDFLFCNPLLVDLFIACYSGKSMKLFIIDQLEDSYGCSLDELERHYITNHFIDEQGKIINLETSPYGLNMSY
jgi:hypothetical protein